MCVHDGDRSFRGIFERQNRVPLDGRSIHAVVVQDGLQVVIVVDAVMLTRTRTGEGLIMAVPTRLMLMVCSTMVVVMIEMLIIVHRHD